MDILPTLLSFHHYIPFFCHSTRPSALTVLAPVIPSIFMFTRLALNNFRSWLKSYFIFKAFSDHPLKNISDTTFPYLVLLSSFLIFLQTITTTRYSVYFISCMFLYSKLQGGIICFVHWVRLCSLCTVQTCKASVHTLHNCSVLTELMNMIRQSFMQLKNMDKFSYKSIVKYKNSTNFFRMFFILGSWLFLLLNKVKWVTFDFALALLLPRMSSASPLYFLRANPSFTGSIMHCPNLCTWILMPLPHPSFTAPLTFHLTINLSLSQTDHKILEARDYDYIISVACVFKIVLAHTR